MVTVYSKRYLDEYDIIDKSYHYPKNPNAKLERDTLARQLRKEGWTVKTKKMSFQDLGFGDSYTLFAERKKPSPQPDFVKAVQSHRNGISGNHFYSVFFDHIMDGKTHELIAVVIPGQGNCFIVSKNDPEICWRGDHFEKELKEAVAQWVSKKFNVPLEKSRKELE